MDANEYWNTVEAVSVYGGVDSLRPGEAAAVERCLAEAPGTRRVLDLGCGGGRTTALLQEMAGEVIGVDFSCALIQAARQRHPEIDFRVATAEALSFDDDSFDIVFVAGNSLDYIGTKAGRERALREVHRVLRPGGHFVISHHNMASWLFKIPRLNAHLLFRVRNILNGNILKEECFLLENDIDHRSGGIPVYHSWAPHLLSDLSAFGFEPLAAFANNPSLVRLQRWCGGDWIPKFLETLPYYALRKRAPAGSIGALNLRSVDWRRDQFAQAPTANAVIR